MQKQAAAAAAEERSESHSHRLFDRQVRGSGERREIQIKGGEVELRDERAGQLVVCECCFFFFFLLTRLSFQVSQLTDETNLLLQSKVIDNHMRVGERCDGRETL